MTEKTTGGLRALLVTVVVLLGVVALAAAYLVGDSGDDGEGGEQGVSLVAAGPDQPQAGMRMTGSGTVDTVPDQLSFALSVTAKQTQLDAALDESSTTMRRVLAKLEQYGVRRADVQTTGLTMNPEYDYPSYGPPVLTGYRVTQQARVEVTDLAQGGGAITAAVTAGGNGVRVHGIRLEVGDPQAATARARDAAVADATAKAEQYAAATGQSLGDVLSIKEVSAPASAPQAVYGRTAALSADASVPIRAGRSELTVRVEVVWSLA